ncbi:hypothetical protein N4G70_28655 [Streptomyces sp. ASQP_92]|uniref:hypothetical protein n=1 Tax=Streptomyces sp. ASQP_92 TaxID=2979116 RepID=UPI0021BE520B|nr:hypothetical protein [Streptomyces sp. ASQP_92]MCT9092811.1 hypothetical protein [Streptomyces sp. ASQP_92]
MGVSYADPMPGHCWAPHPQRGVRCLEKPRHKGQHFNWFTQDRWTGADHDDKAPAQARD